MTREFLQANPQIAQRLGFNLNQQRGGLLDSLRDPQSALRAGAAIYSAGSAGRDPGTGILAGFGQLDKVSESKMIQDAQQAEQVAIRQRLLEGFEKAQREQQLRVALAEEAKKQGIPDAVAQVSPELLAQSYQQMTPYQEASLAQQRDLFGKEMNFKMAALAAEKMAADNKELKPLIKEQKARVSVSDQVQDLAKKHYKLYEQGGTYLSTDPYGKKASGVVSSSALGQKLAEQFGTQANATRKEIDMTKTAILSAIKKATGMSAQELNSNVELQLYLRQATDTSFPLDANLAALANIDKLYGTGSFVPTIPSLGNASDGFSAREIK